jgi:hypothetical protein
MAGPAGDNETLRFGGTTMEQSNFEDKLTELLGTASSLPTPQKEKILFLARRSNETYKILQDKIATLQNSLDYLRVGVKYMIFDLEATRRENALLRKQLEQQQGPNTPKDPDNNPSFE